MRMKARGARGVTLLELMIGMAILAVMAGAFAALLRYSGEATRKVQTQGEAQESTRQALAKFEESLLHANEIRVASATLVEFVCDIDQAPGYDPGADWDGDGVPNFRDGDRDADVQLLMPSTAQWRIGFNLKDDDEDGDGQADLVRRIYLEGSELKMDASVNGAPWGSSAVRLMQNVSAFALGYFGNKANPLGQQIDTGLDGLAGTGDAGENDGIITAEEMDMTQAPAGMGNRNGVLDTVNERRYITSIRIILSSDANRDGRTDYAVETDVYPPLLPLKSR